MEYFHKAKWKSKRIQKRAIGKSKQRYLQKQKKG